MTLKWTTTAPTVAGWYWYRDDPSRHGVVVEWSPRPGELHGVAWFAGNECEMALDELPGEWAGPLAEPEEP